MSIYNWLIIACWAVFIAYWAFSAVGTKRNLSTSAMWHGVWVRIGLAIVVLLIVRAEGANPQFFNLLAAHTATLSNPALSIVGVIFSVVGIGFAIWARTHLGRNWGMPMTIKEKPDLVMNGPYRLVRHPIYTGILLAILGSTLVASLWWLVIFFIAGAYFVYSATQEERQMQKEFPERYPAYKARTKMLIPYVF